MRLPSDAQCLLKRSFIDAKVCVKGLLELSPCVLKMRQRNAQFLDLLSFQFNCSVTRSDRSKAVSAFHGR